MADNAGKPVPQPTPDTQPYWDAAAAGELRLPRCGRCDLVFFYPRSICPSCSSTEIHWFTASGRGRLHSYLIAHRPSRGFEDGAPYAIAIVALDEGPQLMSNIVDIPNDPEHLILDMELEVIFDRHGDVSVPKFRPAKSVRAAGRPA